MRITKIIQPDSTSDPALAVHRLKKAINDRFGSALYFDGERESGQSRVFQWVAAGGIDIVMRLIDDKGFGFWYFEIEFSEDTIDCAKLRDCIGEHLLTVDSDDMLESARRPEAQERDLIPAALVLRDVGDAELAAIVSEKLRSADLQSIQDVLMAALLLDDPAVLPALADAREKVSDLPLADAIGHLESKLERRRI